MKKLILIQDCGRFNNEDGMGECDEAGEGQNTE